MVIECFSGFQKKPNSTKQPTGGTSKTVRLKDNCSVLNPVFVLNGYDLSHNYVRWGSRYYYIDDIVIVANDLAEYHCSSDALATFKADIGASSQYVVRSASAFNTRVMDRRYPTLAQINELEVPLSSISSGIDIDSGTFVIGLKSKEANAGVAFYAMTSAQFSDFVSYLYSDVWLDATDVTTALQKMLVDPFDYVVSCNWYPFTITGTQTSVYFGFWDWTGHTMQRIPESNRIKSFVHTGSLADHPQIARGQYLNATPFTQMAIDLYAFGKFVIDPNRFIESRSYIVNMGIDLFTGIGTCKVFSSTGLVYKSSATCSVPIQLSQVKNDLTRPVISAAGAAVAIATENYVGAAGAIADAVHNTLPQISTIGAVGSIGAYAYNPPKIELVRYMIADEDNAQIGRPLMSTRTISSLSGFIQCDGADLDTAASPSEKAEIISAMNGGFYYE